MSSAVPRAIAYGLGAAVSPVAVMVLIGLMFTKKPVRNSLLYLLGFTMTLVAIGVVAALLLHAGGPKGKSTFDLWIDVVLGALCLLAIPFSLWRQGKKNKEPAGPRDVTAVKAFIIGIVSMAVNASTIVIYIAGVHYITTAKLSALDDVILFAIMTFFTLTTLLVPLGLYVAFPTTGEKAMSWLRQWLTAHSKWIGAGILLIFGVYLLIKGIKGLV